jgi:hypothetical protein
LRLEKKSGSFVGRVGVFVKSSDEIPFDFAAVRAEMLASVDDWLYPLLLEARAESRLLEAELGLPLPDSKGSMHLELRQLLVQENELLVPFLVLVDDLEPWWAGFDCVLTAAWFGDRRTQLATAARYEPPQGISAADQILLHGVVESVSRHFLAGVGAEMNERLVFARTGLRSGPDEAR